MTEIEPIRVAKLETLPNGDGSSQVHIELENPPSAEFRDILFDLDDLPLLAEQYSLWIRFAASQPT
jgi:hypothetical protein